MSKKKKKRKKLERKPHVYLPYLPREIDGQRVGGSPSYGVGNS